MCTMKKLAIAAVIPLCLTLSSCATITSIQENETLSKAGSFSLCPVQENGYWYNGTSYEYNEYQIEVTSTPCAARIQWNGKNIGTTPFLYRYSGVIDKNERITIQAAPLDATFKAQSATLKVRQELPRKIAFDFRQQ